MNASLHVGRLTTYAALVAVVALGALGAPAPSGSSTPHRAVSHNARVAEYLQQQASAPHEHNARVAEHLLAHQRDVRLRNPRVAEAFRR